MRLGESLAGHVNDCEAAVQQGTCGEMREKRVGIDVEIELQNERECGLS